MFPHPGHRFTGHRRAFPPPAAAGAAEVPRCGRPETVSGWTVPG